VPFVIGQRKNFDFGFVALKAALSRVLYLHALPRNFSRNAQRCWLLEEKIYYCINFKRGSILQGIQKCSWQTRMTFMYKWRVLNLYLPGETLLRKHLVRE